MTTTRPRRQPSALTDALRLEALRIRYDEAMAVACGPAGPDAPLREHLRDLAERIARLQYPSGTPR